MATSFEGDVSRWLDSECAYPTSDGRPMGETDLHRGIMFALINALQWHFSGQRTYVSGNILLFYERGDRRRHVSPDVLVVRDLEQRNHENYLLWVEGRPPNLVIEVTSRTTRKEDLQTKFKLYRDVIRVAEYVLFDPLGDYLDPTLQGYRLEAGQYLPIDVRDGRLHSLELGLDFVQVGEQLRIFDPARGEWVLTSEEFRRESLARQASAEREQRAAQRRRRAAERRQREAEKLRIEAENLRTEAERKRSEAERKRMEAERQRTEAERQRSEAEEQRVAAEQRAFDAASRLQAEAERFRQLEEQSRLDRQELARLQKLLAESPRPDHGRHERNKNDADGTN